MIIISYTLYRTIITQTTFIYFILLLIKTS